MKELSEAKLEMIRNESAEELYNFVKNYLEKNHPEIWNKLFYLILRDMTNEVAEIKNAVCGKEAKGE